MKDSNDKSEVAGGQISCDSEQNNKSCGRRNDFFKTVNFKTPNKLLVDFCGCPLSSADEVVKNNLMEFLGIYDFEKVLQYYDIDMRGVGDIIFPPKPHYKSVSDKEFIDDWGLTKRFTGMYWDIVNSPLKDKDYDFIKNYPFPDISSFDLKILDSYAEKAKYLYNYTDYIVVGSHPCYGVFEIACWLFSFDDLLYRLLAEPETVEMFFARILEYQKTVSKLYYDKVGKYIHMTSSGDDFATQNSTFCSPALFKELIAPYFKERIMYTKQLTKAKFLHHSCGNVFSLMDILIDCGVEVLNPIQPCSKEMDGRNLKKSFSGKMVFHGGFDTQDVLINRTPQEIDELVKFQINSMKEGGGYIFAAAHCIQQDVPIENLNAMLSATKKYK